MQTNAKHQQHHANFSQLAGDLRVGHEPRSEWPDEHPGQQIAHQRGQLQTDGKKAKNQGEPEARGDGADERDAMGHAGEVSFKEFLRLNCLTECERMKKCPRKRKTRLRAGFSRVLHNRPQPMCKPPLSEKSAPVA